MDFSNLHRQLSREMKIAEKTKRKIVFLDEVVFTKSTMVMRAYSSIGQNITVNQAAIYSGYVSVVAAISTDNKVEHLHLE